MILGHHSARSSGVAVRAVTSRCSPPGSSTVAPDEAMRFSYQSGLLERPPHEAITTNRPMSRRYSNGTVCGRLLFRPLVVRSSMSLFTSLRPTLPLVRRKAAAWTAERYLAVWSRIGALCHRALASDAGTLLHDATRDRTLQR